MEAFEQIYLRKKICKRTIDEVLYVLKSHPGCDLPQVLLYDFCKIFQNSFSLESSEQLFLKV